MLSRRRFVRAGAAACTVAAFAPLSARAAEPLDQVRILYPFTAGSAGDAAARRIAAKLGGTRYSRNAAIVENKPGAAGRLALEALKHAVPDGATLAMAPWSCMAIYPHIYSKLAYDPQRDFAPVSTAAVMHNGLAVGAALPVGVRDVKAFLAWAAANAAQANYGIPAAGGTSHFIGALLAQDSGVELRSVPYRGTAPGVVELLGGQIAAMIAPHGEFIPHHRAGKLRLIATSGAKRSPFVAEVPTLAEQGFAQLTVEEWFGFYAPAATPQAIVDAASEAINAALRDAALIEGLSATGLIARGSTPRQMAESQQEEFERWGPLVKRIGFRAES